MSLKQPLRFPTHPGLPTFEPAPDDTWTSRITNFGHTEDIVFNDSTSTYIPLIGSLAHNKRAGTSYQIDLQTLTSTGAVDPSTPPLPFDPSNSAPGWAVWLAGQGFTEHRAENYFQSTLALSDSPIYSYLSDAGAFVAVGDNNQNSLAGSPFILGMAGDDVLTGGPPDNFIDGGEGQDTVVFHLAADHYNVSRDGGLVTVAGKLAIDRSIDGTDTLFNIEYLRFTDETIAVVNIPDRPNLSSGSSFGDFDKDGKADVLWRDADGTVAIWQMGGNSITGHFLNGVSSDWKIEGTGDFNGDGHADILWLSDNGSLLDWQMAESSKLDTSFGLGSAPTENVLAGIGDVDHDGKSDLIWRDNVTGAVTISTMAGASNTISGTGNAWQVVGVGDYNGDGTADIMFRNASQGVNAAWLMNGTALGQPVFYPGVPNDWHVEGTGDFNGDGIADLFWHNDNGGNAVWLLNTSGGIQQAGFFDGVSADWHIAGTGDFNNDQRDDVIWRNDAGATAVWQMNGAQTPAVSFPGGVPNDWTTQAHHYEYV